MKRWDMIHHIKTLHDNVNGLSMRQIRDELGISKNTVKKYLKMDEVAICDHLSNREREKTLDQYKEWILQLLPKDLNMHRDNSRSQKECEWKRDDLGY